MRPLIASCVLLSAVTVMAPAFAQDQPAAGAGAPSAAAPAPGGGGDPTQPAGQGANPGTNPTASTKPFDEGFSPVDAAEAERKKKEAENKTQWFLGARFRDFIVPSFIFHMFASGGPGAVNVFSSGPELTMRSGNLEADFSITVPWADFSMKPFLFKAKNDPDEAYERVSSDLKLVTASVDLLGNIPLDKDRKYSILIGGGVGVSGVAGNIYRNQVYPKNANSINPNDPSQWVNCATQNDPAAPKNPKTGNTYCDASNNHYGSYTEPSWAHGGSKPFIFPYLALPHIAFRMQPVKAFQLRVDGGFSVTGFFFGASAGLKLPI